MLLMLRRFMATLIALLLLSTAASGQMPNASYPPISAGPRNCPWRVALPWRDPQPDLEVAAWIG